jgi:hypothetical protein
MNATEDLVIAGRRRVMQIIASALLIGVTAFLAIVLHLVHVQNQGRGTAVPQELPLVSLMGAGFLVIVAVVSFVVPAGIVRSNLLAIAEGTWKGAPQRGIEEPATDSGKLLAVYLTALIVGLALLEGASFFNCIAYLLEAQPFTLGCVGVGVVLMLARFPTEGRVRHWLEDHQEQLAQARRESGPAGRVR